MNRIASFKFGRGQPLFWQDDPCVVLRRRLVEAPVGYRPDIGQKVTEVRPAYEVAFCNGSQMILPEDMVREART
jgi:hypothetical protein